MSFDQIELSLSNLKENVHKACIESGRDPSGVNILAVSKGQSIDAIKEALTSSTTLSHYDPTLPVSIACDASQVGIGAALFHTLPDNSEKP